MHVDADADQGPVAARAQLDVLDLRAPVLHRDHRLPAALDVAHRLAQPQRRRGDRGLLGIGGDARAEAAADVGHRHVDGVLLEAERAGEDVARGVGRLQRRPDAHAAGLRIGHGHGRRRLHRHGRQALVDEAAAHDDVGALERALVGVAALEGEVRALVGEQLRRAVLERALGVDDDVERLDVDLDELGGVDRGAAALGHDDRDRLALEAHEVARQRRAQHVVGRHRPRREGPEVEVGAGEHAHDAGGRRRGLGVDAQDAPVGDLGAHEVRVERARGVDVVGVGARSLDERRVLAAAHRRAVLTVDRCVRGGHGRASYSSAS